MEPRTPAPNIRAAVSTAVCTLLAVAAHQAAMGGAGIPVAAIVFGAVLVFCFARVAAGFGERGLGTIGLLVGGSQIGLHLLFLTVQTSRAGAQQGMPSAAGMARITDMAGMPGMPGMTGFAQIPGPAHMPVATLGMTLGHVLAAIAAAWWLRRGEAALFATVERARAVLGTSWRVLARWIAGARPLRPAGPAAPAAGFGSHKPVAALVLMFTVTRRGPPTGDWLFSG